MPITTELPGPHSVYIKIINFINNLYFVYIDKKYVIVSISMKATTVLFMLFQARYFDWASQYFEMYVIRLTQIYITLYRVSQEERT